MNTLTLPQPFEPLDHTADAGVIVRGASEAEALGRLVLAMTQLLTGGGPLVASRQLELSVEPGDRAAMATDLLRELLYLFDTRHELAASCRVLRLSPGEGARIEVSLGPYDERAHVEGTELKAVTLHAARFEPQAGGWVAQVLFDV